MRWIVGIDFKGRCVGALRLARWLHQHTGRERFVAVHAPAPAPLADLESDEMIAKALRKTRQVVVDHNAQNAMSDIVVDVQAKTVRAGLERARAELGADGLLVGRRATAGDSALNALGRVSRRLLRHLEVPTIIVPPDLATARLQQGPILVATDLSNHSIAALKFAAQLAKELDRPLSVVHVVEVSRSLRALLAGDVWESTRRKATEDGHAGLVSWLHANGEADAPRQTADGPIGATVRELAESEGACMIVCGSRRLSLVERVFTSSVGSELAATAPVPVAIVPATEAPA